METTRVKRKFVPVKKLDPSQLRSEWKKLGRRAMKLWDASGGADPEIDVIFKRMDALDRALAKAPARFRFTVRCRDSVA